MSLTPEVAISFVVLLVMLNVLAAGFVLIVSLLADDVPSWLAVIVTGWLALAGLATWGAVVLTP